MHPVVVWFRDDLRLADNPALQAALSCGAPLLCLYIFDEESPGIRPLGGAARWWLHHSLEALSEQIHALGNTLIIRQGPAAVIIDELISEVKPSALFWNRRYGTPERTVDQTIKTTVRGRGIEATSFAANLLFEPWTIQTQEGHHFSVYTPFWRACMSRPAPRRPLPAPDTLHTGPTVDRLYPSQLGLLPTSPDWSTGLQQHWTPGEHEAEKDLNRFVAHGLARYVPDRDRPAEAVTSRLAPRLRFGEMSPFQVWDAVVSSRTHKPPKSVNTFLSELGWREFAYHTLFAHPELATVNIRREFDAFPWPSPHPARLRAWQEGTTGIPLVDAGMRELWATGSMHNRVRMVTASFLTKNLLIDWRIGEQWFWDTLVDADAASNPFNWQWVAGSGADAAPYFRVFNPELQREKFDPQGTYVKLWVPEWNTGRYGAPVVDLVTSRREALTAFDTVKQTRREPLASATISTRE